MDGERCIRRILAAIAVLFALIWTSAISAQAHKSSVKALKEKEDENRMGCRSFRLVHFSLLSSGSYSRERPDVSTLPSLLWPDSLGICQTGAAGANAHSAASFLLDRKYDPFIPEGIS